MARYTSSVPALQNRADTSRSEYLSRLNSFDPMSFLTSANGASIAQALELYSGNDAARRNGLSASGFAATGPGGVGAINRDLNDRVARAFAANALQAGQLEQQHVGDYGSLYQNDQEVAMDTARTEAEQEAANKASKRGMWGSIIGGLGGLAGTVLTGPIGGALAGKITGRLATAATGGR